MMARSDGASLDRRLLDEIADPVDARPDLLGVDDAVGADVRLRHALDREHRAIHFVEHVDHLPQRRRLRVDHVVAQDDRERLVADQVAR